MGSKPQRATSWVGAVGLARAAAAIAERDHVVVVEEHCRLEPRALAAPAASSRYGATRPAPGRFAARLGAGGAPLAARSASTATRIAGRLAASARHTA